MLDFLNSFQLDVLSRVTEMHISGVAFKYINLWACYNLTLNLRPEFSGLYQSQVLPCLNFSTLSFIN